MRRALLLVVLLLVAAAAWLGVRGVLAERHLQAARTALTGAQDALAAEDAAAAAAAVTRAGRDTRAAARLTGDPVWGLAARVPYLGRTPRTAAGLAAAADDVARRVLPGLVSTLERLDPQRLRAPDGTVDLARVAAAEPGLRASAERAAQVRRRVARLPATGLPGPVRRARADLLVQAGRLADGTRVAALGARLAPPLLGAERPRRYFVLIQQPGESRGTGGLPAAYAIVQASRGRTRVTEQAPVAALPEQPLGPTAGLPPAFVERYQPLGAFRYWMNSNLSPDLPVVARLVAARWAALRRPPLDGVLTLDPRSLADLLQGSGPLDVGGGRTIRPEQVPDYLAVGQYEGLPAQADQSGRKDRLQAIARRAVLRLQTGGESTRELLGGLGQAVSTGHLRMAGLDPDLAALLGAAGVDGALPAGPAPVAYPVVNNFAGGKLDTWLSRSVTYTAGPCTGPRRRSRVSVTLRSDPPAVLPPYVTYDATQPNRATRTSRVRLSVYLTAGAAVTTAGLDGQPLRPDAPVAGGPALTSGTEAGLPVYDVVLELSPGRPRTLTLDLVEPTAAGLPRVPEQPLVIDLVRRVSVPPC